MDPEVTDLKSIPIFSDMDDTEIAGVRAIMEEHHYFAGQVILYEGEPGELFHVLIDGHVDFITYDGDGNELVLDEMDPGGYFGELAMLTGEPRSVRVRASDAVTTLALTRDDFHKFLLAHPHAGIDVLTVISRRLYKTDALVRQSHPRNVNEVHDERQTLGERVSDAFAEMMGSWKFIIIQSTILVTWVILNILAWTYSWDPYPFILLNLALSFQAAYSAPIIMMSQNRQSDKDRIAAEIDHETNIKAEMKAGLIMSRLDNLEKGIHELHRQHLALIKSQQIG